MAVPPLLDAPEYTIYAQIENHDFGNGFSNIPTYAYEYLGQDTVNTYLGPTLTWHKGDSVKTNIVNLLGNGNTTTVHWHGANIPAYTDGGPHQTIAPGDTFSPAFKVLDAPANLWYHPHAEDVTYTQVQMGLAGLIIVKEAGDTVETQIPHTYGEDDFPIIIQDLDYAPNNDTIDTVFALTGATIKYAIINGTIQPTLTVPPQPVRFRILDGSTKNSYLLAIVKEADTALAKTGYVSEANALTFNLLGSDGGYLPDSVRVTDSLLTSSGIRNDILVDFTGLADSTFYLTNFSNAMPTTIIGSTKPPTYAGLLQIKVGTTIVDPNVTAKPNLPAIAALPAADTVRNITLGGQTGIGADTTDRLNIDGNQFEVNTINTVVMFNTVERWRVKNNSTVAHPFHVHLVQFFVDSLLDATGTPVIPLPNELLGPKDNVLIDSGYTLSFRAIFDTYASSKPFNPTNDAYMYHCHILTHEDGYYGNAPGSPAVSIGQRSPWGMMQQFVVWNGVVNNEQVQPLGANMSLFPNPATGEISIRGESTKLSTLRIFDLQGKMLMEKLLPPFNGTVTFDVALLPAGMVVVELQSPEGKFTKKVVITR